jgi:predicted amidohydrolase YtcJ
LDAAFPTRPVWLTRTDGHAGWANTAALNATIGLRRLRNMADPDGGRIRRDDRGTPTGILIDRAMALVTDRLPPLTDAQHDRALRTALDRTSRYGITGLHDAGVTLSEIQRFRRCIDEDRFPLRVYAMILGRGDTFDHFCERGPLHHPSGRLDVASVKFFADGALGSRGAALLDDYADAPGHRGPLRHAPEAFRRAVQAAAECGLQVNTHAIGDRAARTVLDAYEAVTEADGPSLRRPRIEHAQVVAPTDVARFRDLGVTASVQPAHAASDADWAQSRLGPTRLPHAYAWTTLHEAGVPLAFGSDAPVEPLGPLDAFAAAVTAQTIPDGDVLSPPLPRSVALHAHTLGAARAAGRADTVGSITPGKRADFVVLSDDLCTVPPSALSEIEVHATYLGGRPTFVQDDTWAPSP